MSMITEEEMETLKKKNPELILIIGPRGVGKTSQVEKISKEFRYTKLDINNLIDEEIIAGSELGEKLQKSWDCQSKRWDTDIVSISNSADASIDWFNSHLPLLGQNIELIDDTDTGIKSYHTHQQNNTPIYTIYGQRVHHTKKGIYIQDGKKIYIK